MDWCEPTCSDLEEYQKELSQVLKEARERLKFKPRIVELAQVKQTKFDTHWHQKIIKATSPGCSNIHPSERGSRGGDHICWHPCKVGFLTRLIACHTFWLWIALWIQKPYLSRFLSCCGTASHHCLFTFRRGDKLAVWRRSGAAKQILGKIEPAFFRYTPIPPSIFVPLCDAQF